MVDDPLFLRRIDDPIGLAVEWRIQTAVVVQIEVGGAAGGVLDEGLKAPQGVVVVPDQRALDRERENRKAHEQRNPPPTRRPDFDLYALFPPSCRRIADYFGAVARSTQTPPELVAMLGLAIASATICNVARVRGFGDHVEPAPLWMLVLADPASRKSAVFAELLHPVFAWEREQADAMRPIIAEAQQRRRIDEKRLRRLEERAAKGDPDTEAEAIALAAKIAQEPIPTAPRLVTSEPTPEGVSRQMAENDGRALLASSEGDPFDIMAGRYTGGQRNFGIYLKGHAGDPVRATRGSREGDMIDHPALAVALTCQRAAVEAIFSDEQAAGRGLLARFLICSPRELIGSRDVRPAPIMASERAAWESVIGRLLSFEPRESPVEFRLDPAADRTFERLQRLVERELGDGGLSDRRAWGGKLPGAVLRVALALHGLSTWGIRGGPEAGGPIPDAAMLAAVAWSGFLALSERFALTEIRADPDERRRRRLADWIEAQGGAVTVRDLQRGPRAYRDEPGAARAALDDLVEAGYGAWEPVPGGRTIRFRLRRAGGDGDTSPPHAPENPEAVTVASVTTPDDDGWGEL